MSKILEKKLLSEVLRGYWRQCVALVIALRNKWHDPFARSESVVIILQIAFAIVILVFAYIFFTYLYEDILKTVISGITKGILEGNFDNADSLVTSLQIIKAKNFVLFSTILVAITAVFTFLIAKMTLKPTKDALNSQKRFISDIAHELRTPLAVIKTSNEVALMDTDIDPNTKTMIEGNIVELDRMSEIINNTLSFNNLLRPERMKFGNVNMGPLIDSAIEKLRDLALKRQLDITTKKVPPHIVWGNAVALEQVITNLLKNAINYTPSGGHVTLRVGPDYYGKVILEIEDTGIGIAKKDLLHIFEPFYRAERSRNRSNGSSGLGLTIVNELVKIHSGSLTVKSAENKGTIAIVTLPYGKNVDTEDNVKS